MSIVASHYAQRVVCTIFFVALGIYFLIATLTYTPFDPGWLQVSSTTQHVSNASGASGAWLADLLYAVVGWAAILIPIFLFIEAIQLWWPRSYLTRPFRYAAQFFIILTTSALLYFLWIVPTDSLANASGGIVGLELGRGLEHTLTKIGALLFLGIFNVVLWTFAFKIEWNKVGAGIVNLPTTLRDWFYMDLPDLKRKKSQMTTPVEPDLTHDTTPVVEPEATVNMAANPTFESHFNHAMPEVNTSSHFNPQVDVEKRTDHTVKTEKAPLPTLQQVSLEELFKNPSVSAVTATLTTQQIAEQMANKTATVQPMPAPEPTPIVEPVIEPITSIPLPVDALSTEMENTLSALHLQQSTQQHTSQNHIQDTLQDVEQDTFADVSAPLESALANQAEPAQARSAFEQLDDFNEMKPTPVKSEEALATVAMPEVDVERIADLENHTDLPDVDWGMPNEPMVTRTADMPEATRNHLNEMPNSPSHSKIDWEDDDLFDDLFDDAAQASTTQSNLTDSTTTVATVVAGAGMAGLAASTASAKSTVPSGDVFADIDLDDDFQHDMGKRQADVLDDWDDLDAPLTERAGRVVSRSMQVAERRKDLSPLPSLESLDKVDSDKKVNFTPEQLRYLSEKLELKLQDFNIKAQVIEAHPGPVVTRFELELAPGVKASKVTNISKDLARSMSMASVRVVEVIPGKPYIGIEVPNEQREMVRLVELLNTAEYRDPNSLISMAMGKDISGVPVLTDLAKAPHMLVAGTTGSGKSVAVNSMILSMLLKYKPEELRLILIDPKQLELAPYNDIPHLLTPVITEMKDAVNALNWCVNEMERRYKLISYLKVRKINEYNRKVEEAIANGEDLIDPTWKPEQSVTQQRAPRLQPLPMIVIVADEFADMIMQVGKKAEEMITRLAQKSRAAGIHLLLATQRPSVDVITGLIKANIPTRVALRVNSKVDSRTILDAGGAEDLLGHGDMLFLAPGKNEPIRAHGAFISDDEVNRICDAWRERGSPNYIDEILTPYDEDNGSSQQEFSIDGSDADRDPLYDQCVAFVIESRKASASILQRKFSLGYNRAARMIDQMEADGIIGAPVGGNSKRDILV